MKSDRPPTSPGTYALHLELPRAARVRIGRLGTFVFPAGSYIYVGSALGPGGLRARLERHLRRDKKIHWHIDYLLTRARVISVEYDCSGERLECVWAQMYEQDTEMSITVPGFGASDCSCRAHLFRCASSPQKRRGPVERTLC